MNKYALVNAIVAASTSGIPNPIILKNNTAIIVNSIDDSSSVFLDPNCSCLENNNKTAVDLININFKETNKIARILSCNADIEDIGILLFEELRKVDDKLFEDYLKTIALSISTNLRYKLIDSIIFSGIEYVQTWFKNLLQYMVKFDDNKLTAKCSKLINYYFGS